VGETPRAAIGLAAKKKADSPGAASGLLYYFDEMMDGAGETQPQNWRAEWLTFRLCLFYFAVYRLWKMLDFRRELGILATWY
jgi:hypothetical protein